MAIPKVHILDFETAGIQNRPVYPPVPVGFSLKSPGDRKSRYYAWGHPIANNCTFQEAQAALKGAWTSGLPILMHNAKFDYDVATIHMKMPALDWRLLHDTLYLLFLSDPHAMTLALKPASTRLLNMPPEERDVVRDWLVDHKIVKKVGKDWGAHICDAPGDIVGAYADGDVLRTEKLFKLLYPQIQERGMVSAYDRERQLMPILLENERQGIRVDLKTMRSDFKTYTEAVAKTDAWLRKRLKTKDLNVDSDNDLADALERAGVVTQWVLTATGQRSVAKKNLTPDMFEDQKVASALGYRNRLSTCLGTFLESWIATAEASGGMIYTNWNQVRQAGDGSGFRGARTGRLSSNPNFQNIPKIWDDKDDGYVHPKHLDVLELPAMRKYFLPDKGGLFCHRDYNQQELRILAHFEDASLCQAYREDPLLDVHTFVQNQISTLFGLHLERRAVKVLNFGMIYGLGLAKLAIGVHTSVEEARRIKDAQMKAIPGLANLNRQIKEIGKSGQPIVTWGGRQYYTEPPRIIDGRKQTFEYKLLNYLVQSSAADCTKQALINYDAAKKDGRLLSTVHDEINLSVPKSAVKGEMKILREAMADVAFDVPMISDGKTGLNWGCLTKFKDEV
jgi:DNA polymerase-1